MMKRMKRGILALGVLALGALALSAPAAAAAQAAGEDLAAKFQNPPDSAKPHTWWHWMNGNVTKAGITADLEAMKKVGIGGAQIFNAKEGIPHGPINFMSPEWLEMVRFACAEADRLGIELCIHNCAGWSSSGGPWITPDHAMQTVVNSETRVAGGKKIEATLAQPRTRLNYYRDIAVLAYPAKSGAVKREEMVDLSKSMDAAGKLTWDAPAGDWVIQRIGYTPTGALNRPAPDEGTGLECDKLDRGGMDQHWAGIMKPILDKLGPLAGKSLNNALIDSYEVGEQNWSPSFREEFKKRRGYDPAPFLMTIGAPGARGRRGGAATAAATRPVVDSAEATQRFQWDMKRTISDLFTENYYSYFAELCHKAGLKASIEPYTGPFESLQVGEPADIPMGEFWSGSNGHGSVKLAATVGHIYGKNVIGAESFTASPDNGKWTNDPWSIKALGDMVYCTGVNRYIFHRYAMQPWTDRFPGMTMGQWGFMFERTVTWWEQGAEWLKYCARCQALLQSGKFVADIAYYNGEDSPSEIPGRSALRPAMPEGYDYDCLGADVIMKHMSVKDGRIVLDSGMSYRVLALPDSGKYTPRVLAKIAELVKAGATVVGRPATGSPSLQDYPKCDEQVKQLAGELWGAGSGPVERTVGQGKVVSGKPLAEVLAGLGAKPDFDYDRQNARLLYIHRDVEGAEVYFVSNQGLGFKDQECAFRVSGMTPELWHPDTGKMETAPVYSEKDGLTTVKLSFEPAGSMFVVFRKAAAGNHLTGVKFAQAAPAAGEKQAPKLVITKATYAAVDGAPGSVDLTAKVADAFGNGRTAIEAGNELAGRDPAYNHVKQLKVEYTYDGKPGVKTFAEGAAVALPGGGPGALSQFPAFELAAAGEGKMELRAWEAGALSAETAAGKPVKAEVASVPKALEVSGPWTLSFPPNWGAPAQVTLEKLISWTEHPETGVKYFSGTATYTKQVEIPAELVGPDKALALDLGQVKNFAEVSVNGKSLGVLWKPPFRVDLSGVAKAGANTLEVKVTNMWCNRLIGDEQLPDDREWNGKQLKAWPEWVLKGEKSPTGRFTFTTWHHFTKDSPLYEAGMMGPVMVRAAQKLNVEIPR